MNTVKAIELFNSWQGEGQNLGKFITFLRFKACKLPFHKTLCPFCDTRLKMKMNTEFEVTKEQLLSALNSTNYSLCITGGEPGLYLNQIKEILDNFKLNHLEIETNGLNLRQLGDMLISYKEKHPDCYISINLSPKFWDESSLVNYIDLLDKIKMQIVNLINVKLVVSIENKELTDKFLMIMRKNELHIKYSNKIFLMPMGTNMSQIMENSSACIDLAAKYFLNITARIHILYNFI